MENEPNEPTTELADVPKLPSTFPEYQCLKCDRAFASAPALRMHTVRTHGKGWDTSPNFRGARGGKPPSRGLKKARRAYGPGTGKPWSAAQRAKFTLTIRRKQRNADQFSPQKFYDEMVSRVSATVEKPSDQLADAAKAILLAAKVLRGTMTALKLP